MKRLLALLLAPLVVGAAPVDYEMVPIVGEQGLEAIQVTVRFAGDEDGATDIGLPDSWADSDQLHRGITDLSLDGGTLVETEHPARRVARHAPGASLVLRYRLGPIASADPGFDYQKAKPVLRPTWFYILGEGAIASPIGRNASAARFRWADVPDGWTVASNLDVFPAERLTTNDVGGSVFAGGPDLRVTDRSVGGRPLRIAMLGRWAFEDSAFGDALARVIDAGNRYLADEAIPFFVSLAPLQGGETGVMSTHGTGRPGGFALASTTNRSLDYLIRLLAHEYGHRWFGGSFGPLARPDSREFWFTEGVNDFAAAQTLVRAGVWDERRYVEEIDEVLLRYGVSPAVGRSNEALAAAFWEDGAARQMMYDRGHLLALALDRERSVRDSLARMAGRPDSFEAGETQAARFVRAMGLDQVRVDATLEGQPVVLPTDLFAPCGSIRWVEQPVFASGYTVREQGGDAFFETVREGSPAWQAGLRPGMRYVRRLSGVAGDSTVPIAIRVADADGEREIRFLPEGDGTVRFQRLELRPMAESADRAVCRARLAGAASRP